MAGTALSMWVLVAGATFVAPLVLGARVSELESVCRYVYLVAIALAVVSRALGLVRSS